MKNIRLRIANWLRKLADRFDNSIPLVIRVRELVKETDTLSVSGEFKRHVVYAKLIKEFPNVSKRNISLQIELALN